ncbi:O-methyltransferase [Propionispora hippei]|uniref:Predicted O-methyltransferase YrrM n=1 Tax=Propionispora hippei DSM 15287 TaxID=1123003 RepID=A0A1M6G2K2_9FIRM|nr:class I SAM-dependent methyltransferase [Propionispora hippei]SHJ04211.1 Predicted O-methyltransferase YrrM [Propionispora hippei DSM 15287]
MNPQVYEFLKELEQQGVANDAAQTDRQAKMLNITEDTGRFLAILVQSTQAKAILEIGTSNGYSTIWLAGAAQATGGHVTTVELLTAKAEMARNNIAQAGMAAYVTIHTIDAAACLAAMDSAVSQFIFLDAKRSEYCFLWEDISRILKPGGLLVVDNAVSHRQELSAFQAMIEADPQYQTVLVPVGKGELVVFKSGVPA